MNKKELLKNKLRKVKILKKAYLKKTNLYRKLNTGSEVFIIGCGTIATTTLILSFTVIGAPLVLVSVTFSSLATLSTALKKAAGITNKYEIHKQTYLSYADMQRTLDHALSNREISENTLDNIINNIDDRLDLIEGNCIPISEESENN